MFIEFTWKNMFAEENQGAETEKQKILKIHQLATHAGAKKLAFSRFS